ncbi:MAG: hypothetical protein AAFP81_12155 [Pseudomonadota bacterium]
MSLQFAKNMTQAAQIASLFCFAAGVSGIASAEPKSLTIYNDAAGDAYLRFEQADGIGNKILWRSDMQTEAGDVIGTGSGHCTQLDADQNYFCSFVIDLDDRGIIAGQGVRRTEPMPSSFPIIGGSGEFEGVTGTMISRPVEDRARFVYEIEYQ